MLVTIGYWLSGIIALAIVLIGGRFLVSPLVAANGYGLAVRDEAGEFAYLAVKGIRDLTSGLITALLIFQHLPHLLGWFMLIAALIPLGDMLIVLRHGGTKAVAFGIHGATAVLMVVTAALLLMG